MSYGWDELPETNFNADPEARAPGYDTRLRNGLAKARASNAAFRRRATQSSILSRPDTGRADAGLRKFGGEP